MNNNRFMKFFSYLMIQIALLLWCHEAHAIKTHGRIILGTSAITERYNSNTFGSTSNDFLVLSGRFFYKISELGNDKWEIVTDLRDKNDFFGKLNQEQLQLDPKNEFQVRQFSTRWVNPAGSWSSQFGRFQLIEPGAVFVDGANGEYRFNPEWKTGLFAGLNPKSIEKSYLEFDAYAQQAGAYLTYQSKDRGWDENSYVTHGIVQQKYKNETERSFLFQNVIYQWQDDSRIINTAYFDFVPSSKLQTLIFLYQQWWNEIMSTEIGHLHIDVIEYRRNQGVLEKLVPSPYDESHVDFEFRTAKYQNLKLDLRSGKRQIDNLQRTEADLTYNLSQFFSRNVDFQTRIGYRKNFTSNDVLAKFNIGYFSKSWEFFLDQQFEQDKNIDGTTTNPVISEIGATAYLTRRFFMTTSFQRTADENVTIYSTLFRMIYRFGDQETAPIRDGAPPRGAL